MSDYGSPLSDEIADSWLGVATAYAQSRGYTFASECIADLTEFLNGAAVQLRASGSDSTASSHNPDVQRLVQLMIEELNAQSPNDKQLHEWTLIDAKKRFCPLFPFC